MLPFRLELVLARKRREGIGEGGGRDERRDCRKINEWKRKRLSREMWRGDQSEGESK